MSDVVERLAKSFATSRGQTASVFSGQPGRKDEHASTEATTRWWLNAIADELDAHAAEWVSVNEETPVQWLREQARTDE